MVDPLTGLAPLADGLDAVAAIAWLGRLHHVTQALLAGLFTWSITALGASLVLFSKQVNEKLLDAMLGFSAGVMLAASYWSLLQPAIELSADSATLAWVPAAVGFGLGATGVHLIDWSLRRSHAAHPAAIEPGVTITWRRTMLLVFAITLDNLPEGFAVGIAFGALGCGVDSISLGGSIALALGIGLQNFPEGIAVAMPLRRIGWSPRRSFWYGQLSAVVEPMAAVAGASAISAWLPIMPYALAFAAGAMIYVVMQEVIPESRERGHGDLATLGAMVGFIVMMILDVGLG